MIAIETGGPEARTIKNNATSEIGPDTPTAEETDSNSARGRIANLPTERQFFVDLKKSLEIICSFYDEEENQLIIRASRLKEFTDATEVTFQKEGASLSDDEREMLSGAVNHYMDSLRVLYVDFVMLENFCTHELCRGR